MIVSLIGLVVGLLAYLIAFPRPEQRRFDIYGALLALHILTAIGYWLYSFDAAMDAFMYYRDPFNFMQRSPFEEGTYFVVHFVQFIKRTLGGSFLDHFLFFQGIGMIGIALLMRSINEIADSFGMTVPVHAYLILFLPGLHFWTGGIGKDSPMIAAVCLATWAVIRLERRIVWLGVALLIMALIRPHVGAVTGLGVVAAAALTKQISFRAKIVLAPVAAAAVAFIVLEALERFHLRLDFDSVSGFVEYQQDFGERFGSGADLQSLSFPMKVFTLLFRPLFYDSSGMMGYVASLENAFLLYVFGYLAWHWRMVWRLLTRVSYVAYCIVFSAPLIVMLALVNYNVGLGQRQKMMVVPAVLLLYATVYMYKRYLARAASMARQQPLPEGAGQPVQA